LVLAIEQEFGVQFAPEDIAQVLCVADIVTLLTEKLQSTESPL
jgi:acyl carrier protein